MRRALIAGIVGVVVLAVLPLAARAGGAPAITLTTPVADQVVVGELAIAWTYQAFSRTAWVDVEASRGGAPFERIARVRIDDGTPGYVGSTTWATGAGHDASDWTIRVVVPSNKRVQSSVFPVVIDNAGPEMTEVERTPANDAGWNNGEVTVKWACADRASGVVESEVVATAVDEGAAQVLSGTCTDAAGHATTATAEGINIDRTAPSASVITFAADPGTPSLGVFPNIIGTADDALSTVTSVTVTFVDEAGNETQRQATCNGCGTASAGWAVATQGLAVGQYKVTAHATDGAGNTGTSATTDWLIVAAPAVSTDGVTVDQPGDVSQPEQPSEPTVPSAPSDPAAVPVPVPTIGLPA